MSRKASGDLHTLIHALSQAEKRYVKLFLSRHSVDARPQTAALFDAIAAQESYDERELKSRHAHEPFVDRLSVAKNELMRQILRAMRLYHDDDNRETRLLALYADARFLRDRGLVHHAKARFEEAYALATELHDHGMRAKVCLDLRYVNATLGRTLDPVPDTKLDNISAIARAIDEHGFFHAVAERLYAAIRKYGATDAPELRWVAEELHRMALAYGEPSTTDARTLWLRFQSGKAFYVDHDPDAAAAFDLERLKRYDDDPRWRQERMSAYVAILSNTTIRFLQGGRHDEAFDLIGRLRTIRRFELHRLPASTKVDVNSTWAYMELAAAVVAMRFDHALTNMDEILAVLNELDTRSYDQPVRVASHINVALIHWFHQQFDVALRHIDIITRFPSDIRADIQTAARLLRICIAYETDDVDKAENLIRTERRKGAQSDAPRPADEDLFLQTFTKLLQARSRRSIQRIMQETAETLGHLEHRRPSNLTTNIIGFRHWLAGKLDGTSTVTAARAFYAHGAPGKEPDAPSRA